MNSRNAFATWPIRWQRVGACVAQAMLVVSLLACESRPSEHPATALTREFYAWYGLSDDSGGAGFNFERATRERPAFFSNALGAAIAADLAASRSEPDEIVGLDFDPLTASQDPCEHYVPDSTATDGERVRVRIKEECRAADRSRGTPLTLELTQEDGSWRLADVIFADGDRLTVLLARLEASRASRPSAPTGPGDD